MYPWARRLNEALADKGWSKIDLARHSGIDKDRVYKYLRGGVEHPRGDIQDRLADTLDVGRPWLKENVGAKHPELAEVLPAASPDFGPDEVPVYGYAAGTTDDALNLHDGAEIGRVDRHPKQAGINDAFAVYVVGESMAPRFKPGQILYILPGRWPAAGEDVVIELDNGDGYVKEYRRKTQKEIICWQYNPNREWRRPLHQVKAVYSVAGTG